MGWPGNMVSWVEDAAGDIVREAERVADQAMKDAINGVDSLGSYKYLNPITSKLALYGDYKRLNENKANAENDSKAAEAKYNESLKNIGSIADYQDLISKDFDENKDKYTGLLQDADKRTLRGQLAETISGQNNDFNSRGLLFAGGAKMAKQSAKAKNLTDIQNADYENAQTIANQARDFKNQALSTRTASQGGQTGKTITDYQAELAKNQAANEGYAAMGQAGGQIAGTYLAKKAAK